LETARLVKEIVNLKKEGRSNRAIAKKLSVSHWTVKKYWTLRRLIPSLYEAFNAERLSLKDALRLSRLPPGEQAKRAEQILKKHGPKRGPERNGPSKEQKTEQIAADEIGGFIKEGVIGAGFAQKLLSCQEEKRKTVLRFFADPDGFLDRLDKEIAEKRRELEMLNRQIGYKKSSITFMNFAREAIRPLIKAEETLRELSRSGVDRLFFPELAEWLGVLKRVQEIIIGVMSRNVVYDVCVEEEKIRQEGEGLNV
jgi:hypothetical protein